MQQPRIHLDWTNEWVTRGEFLWITFAAGCALCGAALDPRRGQGPPTVADRTRRLFGSLSRRGGQRKRPGDGRTT